MGKLKVPGVDKVKEEWVKDEVKKILKPYSPFLHYWMPPASMYGRSGQHDFGVCQRSLYWTIETKQGKEIPTDGQIIFANKVHAAGGMSIMVNEFDLIIVAQVADYIEYTAARYKQAMLPMHLAHDFNQWAK